MTPRTSREKNELQRVAYEYRARGYNVLDQPAPGTLGLPVDFAPDMIAVGPTENVLIEVKTRQSIKDSALQRLAQFVEDTPGWRLELLVASPVGSDRYSENPLTPDLISTRSNEAVELADQGHFEAALLLAWSGLEAALRERKAIVSQDEPTLRVSAKDLYSLGVLSDRQLSLVEKASTLRNTLVHGYRTGPIDPTLVRSIATLAINLSDRSYPTVDQMVEWFYEHFEDPAQWVPFNSAEGGYQYIRGGPYDAREVLSDQFHQVDELDLNEAVTQIESDGAEWVKKGQY